MLFLGEPRFHTPMNDMNKQNKPEDSPREEVECKSLLYKEVTIEHFYTESQRVVKLRAVKEDDCNWRFEDGSELSYDWHVVNSV